MSAPTLINLPPPSSNPGTPSDMGPGTPNSTTTSLSALSTTAIKDGHQGNAPPHISSRHTYNTLAAERADRISRLAGLERVSTDRTPPPGAFTGLATQSQQPPQQPGYFDTIQAQFRERSTVGSASATGSIGGRTTWASSSDAYDADKMSEDDGVSSIGGLSDEGNASLVGFGEGASSTTSGPISGNSRGRQSGMSSPVMGKASAIPPYMHQSTTSGGTSSNTNNAPIASSSPPSSSPISSDYHNHHQQHHNARLIDGMTYDPDVVDTTARSPQSTTYARNAQQTGTETAERIMRERAGDERGEEDGVEATREARGSLRSSRRGRRDGREGVGGRFYQQEER